MKKDKSQKKNNNKNNTNTNTQDMFTEGNLNDMMNQVNEMLTKNPDMVKKVSKCVSNIFENESLMNNLVSQINTGIVDVDSDTDSDSEISFADFIRSKNSENVNEMKSSLNQPVNLLSNDSFDSNLAESNDSKQSFIKDSDIYDFLHIPFE